MKRDWTVPIVVAAVFGIFAVAGFIAAMLDDGPPSGWAEHRVEEWSRALFGKVPSGVRCLEYNKRYAECDVMVDGEIHALECGPRQGCKVRSAQR